MSKFPLPLADATSKGFDVLAGMLREHGAK
jgi:hypothetical protein